MRKTEYINAFCDRVITYICESAVLLEWNMAKRPIPARYIIKRKIIKEYAKKFSTKTFIETGTYLGKTIQALKWEFDKIYSIELSEELYKKARMRFSRYGHISIVHGDSGEILPDILTGISEPCLFWLDAHYSDIDTAKGKLETPIIKELKCILHHPVGKHVILIDDARLYNGKNGWPEIKQLHDLVFLTRPDWMFEIKYDIIRIHKVAT